MPAYTSHSLDSPALPNLLPSDLPTPDTRLLKHEGHGRWDRHITVPCSPPARCTYLEHRSRESCSWQMTNCHGVTQHFITSFTAPTHGKRPFISFTFPTPQKKHLRGVHKSAVQLRSREDSATTDSHLGSDQSKSLVEVALTFNQKILGDKQHNNDITERCAEPCWTNNAIALANQRL